MKHAIVISNRTTCRYEATQHCLPVPSRSLNCNFQHKPIQYNKYTTSIHEQLGSAHAHTLNRCKVELLLLTTQHTNQR